jgi:hypothetical protein
MNIFDVVLHSLSAIKKNPKFLVPALVFVLFGIVVLSVLGSIFLNSIPGQVMAAHQLYARVVMAMTRLVPFAVLAGIMVLSAGVLVKGMYIDLCYDLKRFPKRTSLRKSFKAVLPRYKDLLIFEVMALVAELIIALIILGPLVYLAQNSIINPYLNNVVISGSSFFGISVIATALVVLYAVLAVALTILLWLGSSIVMLDHSDAVTALKESVRIGRREMLRIFGFLVVSYLLVAIALLISRAFQIIPYAGVIISFIITIGIMTFLELLAPMYYLTFHKNR